MISNLEGLEHGGHKMLLKIAIETQPKVETKVHGRKVVSDGWVGGFKGGRKTEKHQSMQ